MRPGGPRGPRTAGRRQRSAATVELADVEGALARPGARGGGASARTAIPAIAWVVPRRAPTASALRRQPRRLPAPIVPTRFVLLDTLPHASRKLDRGALPAPGPERPALESAYAPATNALESLLAHLWEELLAVRPVGIRDAFLDLGGDSLSAVRMVERVEEALGRKVSLALLASASTVEELARALVAEQPPDLRAPLVPLHPGGTKAPIFFLHGLLERRPLLSPRRAPPRPGAAALAAAPVRARRRPRSREHRGDGGGPPRGAAPGPAPRALSARRQLQRGARRLRDGAAARARRRARRAPGRDPGVGARRAAPASRRRRARAGGRPPAAGGGDRPLAGAPRQLGDAWVASGTGRLRLLRDKLRHLPRTLAPRPAANAPTQGEGPASASPGRHRRERLRDVYTRAAALYVPGPYPGG
jgi:acyl carrier protein